VRAFEFPSRLDIVWTDAIGEPALVVNTAGIVVSCNKDAARLLGRSVGQVVGRRCAAVVRGCLPTGELICTADCPLVQGWGVQPGPPAVEMLVPGVGPHSARRPVVVHHIPVRDIRGRPSGVLHVFKPSGESPPNNPGRVTWSMEVSPPGNHLG
jgi:PAS domain-containing protein